MMKNPLYSGNRLPLIARDTRTNYMSQEAALSQNIHSYFQLAKMIVTKVRGIETEEQKVILLADDEPLTFRLIEEFFQNANLSYEVLQATSGQAAFDIALARKPDLIITDWLMPELDGLGLIRKLMANPETKFIPIIMTTGAIMPNEELGKVLAEGAIDCIRKPFDDIELVARVKAALALQDAMKEIKDNKESLQVKNQFVDFLMDVAPNPIFVLNKLGNIINCNEGFEKLIGKKRQEIIDNLIDDLLFQVSLRNFSEEWMPSIEPGIVSRFEIEFINSLQENENLVLTCIGVGDESAEAVIVSVTDVTEIVQSSRAALVDLEVSVEKLQVELNSNHQKLAAQTELLIHSKNIKTNFIDAVTKLQPYLTNEGKARFSSLIKQIHWELNDEMGLKVEKDFDQLHARLYGSLEKICPALTRNEKRLCAYLKMNNGASDIARITNKSLNSINVAFARLRTKLQIPNSKDLKSFLLEITSASSQNDFTTSF